MTTPRQVHTYTSFPQTPSKHHRHSRRRTRRRFVIGILLAIVLAGGACLALWPSTKHVAAKSPQKKTTTNVAKATTPAPVTDPALTTMSDSIHGIIGQNSDLQISVSLVNLNSNQAVHYGYDGTFQAASTAKLIAAVDWLHQVETGNESMSETVGPDTAANDINQMIVVSNDPDWKAIEVQLGYNNLQNYATGLGLVDYEAFNNSLTSGDIALILQKIWDSSVLTQSDSQLILSYMKEANYRQYIVPAIPAQDTVYHKVGFYEDYLNDAAIVTSGNKAFAIVIFTNGNGVGNWPARAIMMQDITKAALQYYFNQ